MELGAESRRRVLIGAITKRQACREYAIHWQTLQKILRPTEPTPFRTKKPRVRLQLDRVLPFIHHWLKADRDKPKNQRHAEAMVGYARRNFLVPNPEAASWEALHTELTVRC